MIRGGPSALIGRAAKARERTRSLRSAAFALEVGEQFVGNRRLQAGVVAEVIVQRAHDLPPGGGRQQPGLVGEVAAAALGAVALVGHGGKAKTLAPRDRARGYRPGRRHRSLQASPLTPQGDQGRAQGGNGSWSCSISDSVRR